MKRRTEHEQKQRQALRKEIATRQAERARQLTDPTAWLRSSLSLLAEYWSADKGCLLFGGSVATINLRRSLLRLAEIHGPSTAAHIATAILRDFTRIEAARISPSALAAIESVFSQAVAQLPKSDAQSSCITDFVRATLPNIGISKHPPPS